jgi:K+-sensing histidine kinase KdpD
MEKPSSIASAHIDYNILARLSHDVRSPFNGLIGFSDLLSTHYDELSDDKRKEYAELIRQLSRKSFFQLQFFTIWIKIISNNLNLNQAVVEYRDIIEQSIEFCSNEIESRHIKIVEPEQQRFKMHADISLLTTAISSILSSVIRVMEAQTQLTITTVSSKPIHLKISGKFSQTIQPDSDPFQLLLLAKNEYTESSSRLWIAKQIIDKHNGLLSFEQQQDPSLFDIHISFLD